MGRLLSIVGLAFLVLSIGCSETKPDCQGTATICDGSDRASAEVAFLRDGAHVRQILLPLSVVLLVACGDEKNVTLPQLYDDPSIFTLVVTDPAGDLESMPESPPTIPDYPPVDLREMALGVSSDGWFYLRFSFNGTIPTTPPVVNVETVTRQGFNVSMNTDGDPFTGGSGEGVAGIDVYYAVVFSYGEDPSEASRAPYANYGVTSDVHVYAGHATGEFRSGGPGYDFVVFRFDAAAMGQWFPRGSTVDYGAWSEAESTSYHHFAFDRLEPGSWTIP